MVVKNGDLPWDRIREKITLKVIESYTTKVNIAPEKWWLEDDPFLLGRELFRGELLNFGGGTAM